MSNFPERLWSVNFAKQIDFRPIQAILLQRCYKTVVATATKRFKLLLMSSTYPEPYNSLLATLLVKSFEMLVVSFHCK